MVHEIEAKVTHSNPDAVLTDIFGDSPSNGEAAEVREGLSVEYPARQPMKKDFSDFEQFRIILLFSAEVSQDVLTMYLYDKLTDAESTEIDGIETDIDQDSFRAKIDEAYDDL